LKKKQEENQSEEKLLKKERIREILTSRKEEGYYLRKF
jgi:hypothetical protein